MHLSIIWLHKHPLHFQVIDAGKLIIIQRNTAAYFNIYTAAQMFGSVILFYNLKKLILLFSKYALIKSDSKDIYVTKIYISNK